MPINLRKYAKEKTRNITQGTQTDSSRQIDEIYTNVKSIPSYSSKISKYLQEKDVHSKHGRIVKRKFPRRRIIVTHPSQIFMADLIEYTRNSSMKHANRNHVYILLVIDCFSKYVWLRPLKNKKGLPVSSSFREIIGMLNNFPNTIITDEGKEFYNKEVRKVFDNFNIHHYSIKTKMKASIAERAIRTIKTRIERYLAENKTKKWLDILPDIENGYNSTPHRSIGIAPEQVNISNSKKVFKTLYPGIDLISKPKLSKGNIVRVLRKKSLFEKGYKRNWSSKVFLIASTRQQAGRVWYKLSSLNGATKTGSHYFYELKLVSNDIESYRSRIK
jgi:hypothetical protein